MNRLSVVAIVGLLCASCGGGSSSSSPTAPTTSTPIVNTPVAVSLHGTVTALPGGVVAGATVTIADGLNAGKAVVSDASGTYTFAGLAASNANLSVTAPNYLTAVKGIYIDGVASLNFVLQTAQPWTQSGTGNNVFTIPTYITKVRIVGAYSGNSSNFVVLIGGRLVVNDLVGTAWGLLVDDGTYATGGGQVQITNSTGVAWAFTEVR